MAAGEFELIRRYFSSGGAPRDDVRLGVGDDAAVLAQRPGCELVIATDTVVDGVHFPSGSAGRCVGHRALAVNLSDLAAMGAEPAWALLALTLPAVDEAWLGEFATAFDGLARQHGVAWIGGDTTRGPLAATVTACGWVPAGQALTRSGARAGDGIFVSGSPGDAAAGLALLQRRLEAGAEAREALVRRFLLPEPRVALGQRLRGVASACIDVSDGLVGDLTRLCEASGVGCEVDAAALPLSPALREAARTGARALALQGGDDYELLFTVPAARQGALASLAGVTRIGVVTERPGVRVSGAPEAGGTGHGYDHFAI